MLIRQVIKSVLTLESRLSRIISHKLCRIIVCWYISVLFLKFAIILMFVPLRRAGTYSQLEKRTCVFIKVFRMKIGVIADIVVEFTSRPMLVTLDRNEIIQVKCSR